MLGFDYNALVVAPTRAMLDQVSGLFPTLIGGLIILIGGWMVAKVIRIGIEKMLEIIQFERFSDASGIDHFLKKGDVKMSATDAICDIVYYISMTMVLLLVLNVLGGVLPTHLVDGFVIYIPVVLTGVFVLLIGIFFAKFVSTLVRAAAKNVGLPRADVLEDISRWAFIIFALTATLKTLGLHFLFQGTMFTILIGGIVLAMALRFGFNGGDFTSRYLKDLLKK